MALLPLILILAFAGSADAPLHITGTVISDTNAPVDHAVISISRRSAPQDRVTVTTDAAGLFVLDVPRTDTAAHAAADDYVVNVDCPGFFPITDQPLSGGDSAGAAAGNGTSRELHFVLHPLRGYAEEVSVSPQASPVDLNKNGSEQTLGRTELLAVPFAGSESPKSGMATLPGVLQDSFTGIHVNGAPEHEALYLLDGFDISDPLTGGFDPPVTVEAVRAIQVLSGAYSAEYGRGSAGIVNIVTNTGDDHLQYYGTSLFPLFKNQKRLHVGSWTPRATLSGPIVKGHAWYSNDLIAEYNQSVIPELPQGQDTTTSTRVSDFVHTQINLTASNFLYVGGFGSVQVSNHDGLGALDPISTTLDQHGHQWFALVRDQQILRGGVVLDFGYGSNHTQLRQTPQGHDPYVGTPSGRRGNNFRDSLQHSSRDQILANLSLPTCHAAGTHQLKTGIDFAHRGYDQDVTRGIIELLDAQQNPIRTISFAGSGKTSTIGDEFAAYVQDNWHLRTDLVFQTGLRADWDGLVRTWTASPRLGAAWSPAAASLAHTKISGGYTMTHDAARLELFASAADQTPISTFYPPYGTGTQQVRSTFLIPQHLSSPVTESWNLTLDQNLAHGLSTRVQGLRRRQRNGLAYVGTPQIEQDSVYTLANQRTESYDSVEISARQDFAKQYGWMVGFTRSSARSNTLIAIGPEEYFFGANNAGPVSWDAPNRLVSWAYLPTPRPKWSIAYFMEYRTGFPFSAANNAGAIVGPLNSYRYPAYFSLNFDLERRVRLAGQQFAVRIGWTNITNHYNPDSVNSIVDSTQFLQFFGGQPRTFAFRIRWLGHN